MKKRIMKIGKRQVSIFSKDDLLNGTIVYIHMNSDDMEKLVMELNDVNAVLVAIDGVDWNDELSPWPGKKAFRSGEAFAGGADAYLKELTEIIVTTVEGSIGFTPSCRILGGYSLAGLFALYAMYRTAIFNEEVSISGSLWYDGFREFMMKNQPLKIPDRAYFSLGNREKITRNQRLGLVEDRTIQAEKQLRRLGSDTLFELTPGNHFDDVIDRLARDLRWIMRA